jgi:hypothetical protein
LLSTAVKSQIRSALEHPIQPLDYARDRRENFYPAFILSLISLFILALHQCFPDFDEEGNKSWHWRLPKKDGDKPKLPSLSESLANLQKMKQRIKLPSPTS